MAASFFTFVIGGSNNVFFSRNEGSLGGLSIKNCMCGNIAKGTNGWMFLGLLCGLLTVKMNKVQSSLHLERRKVSTF